MAAKKTTSKTSSASAEAMAKTRSIILKTVGKKPLGSEEKQWPYISTGNIVVDNLIGGSIGKDGKAVCPGIPRRRITEIYGPESSGKTTLAVSIAREAQRSGGSVLYLDYEHALNIAYSKAIGMSFDEDKLSFYAPDTLEEGFKIMLIGISSGVDLIVVDSVAAMVPSGELDKNLDAEARVGEVSRLMSQALPKFANWLATLPRIGGSLKEGATDLNMPGTAMLLLNQERAVIGKSGPGTPEANTTGGKALKFYASARLRLTRIKTETVARIDPISQRKVNQPYGNLTQVKIVKDKLDGRQGHTGNILIRYGFGVDNPYSLIESAVAHGIMRREGARYSYGDTAVIGRDKFRQMLLGDRKLYTDLENKVRQAIVQSGMPIDDSEIDSTSELIDEVSGEFGDTPGMGLTSEVADVAEEEVVEASDV